MKRCFLKIVDTIAFFRPLLLIPIWTPALLGFWYGSQNQGFHGIGRLLILTTSLGIGIYGLNQIYDVSGDKINRKNLPLALGFISPALAKIVTFSGFLGALVEVLDQNLIIIAIVIGAIAMGVLYSAPPVRIKDRAWLALIFNAFGHGFLVYLLGFAWAASQWGTPWSLEVFARATAYAIAYGAVYLFTTVPDAEGDSSTGKTTLAVLIGARKTMAIGLLGVFLAGAVGLAFGETALFLTAVVSLPFYWAAVAQQTIKSERIVRANKVAVLTLAVLTCFYIPHFVILLAITIGFAALYNRLRLGVRYP